VDQHLSAALRKLGVSSRTALAVWAASADQGADLDAAETKNR
jgi:DNA-binding NarL/FixJ family response regulator